MTRRGFTLIELMAACAITIVIVTAVTGYFTSIWTLAKGAADEMRGALQARALRERMFYRLDSVTLADGHTSDFGLISARKILLDGDRFYAEDNGNFVYEARKGDKTSSAAPVSAVIDWNPTAFNSKRVYSDPEDSLQCIYLKEQSGKTVYYDRLVATLCMTNPPSKAEILEVFGADD